MAYKIMNYFSRKERYIAQISHKEDWIVYNKNLCQDAS